MRSSVSILRKAKQVLFGSTYIRIAGMAIGVAALGLVLYGSGGAVSVISTNQINSTGGRNQYNFEATSSLAANGAAGNSWVTTWDEYPAPVGSANGPDAGYTSAWNGSSWSGATRHNIPNNTGGNNAVGNLFIATNPTTGIYVLVGLEVVPPPGPNQQGQLVLFSKTSTDSSGQNWNSPVFPLPPGTSADFPSVAVAQNGTIAIGFTTTNNGGGDNGFAVVFSSNGGASWSAPAQVGGSGLGFSFGRIVAALNTFYAFLPGTNPFDPISPARLQVFQWSGGAWSGGQTLITYTAPSTNSPSGQQYCNHNSGNPNFNQCGVLGYSPFIDAWATSAGWAVLCPAARSDNSAVNNFIFCTQSNGCSSMNYPTDLFMGGITTSQNADLWISVLTYSGDPGTPQSPNRTLPLQQIAAYGTSTFSFVTGVPNTNIDPTSWTFFQALAAGSSHCNSNGVFPCFSAGDYVRPAMNNFTGASLPFINAALNLFTVLSQSFVQDPQTGLKPLSGLTIKPLPIGSNVAYQGSWSADEIERHRPRARAVLWP